MTTAHLETLPRETSLATMHALVYHGPGKPAWESHRRPALQDAGDAIVRITTSTICGSDLHILKGDVPTVTEGRILGHEGVGVVEEIGVAVSAFRKGDKVVISCITACGKCDFCRRQMYSHCRNGGWMLGNTIDGTQAGYVRITMAVGARLLAKKEAIVTRLAAIDELAGVDVLCSDKTGTLTQNKLTLGDPFSVNDIPAGQVILCAALASRAEDKDTIDLAVIGGLKGDQGLKGFEVLHFQPFDPVHKRTEATVKGADGKQFYVAKGAPQVILAMAANVSEVKLAVEKAVNEFAGRGFRSLGVARADQERQWQFIGVLPLFDPPREQAKATIASARQMGVSVKMVTGDQAAIARETARQLGMGTNILDASGLGDTKHHESAQSAEAIEKADGFAQVFPEHKFHIVDVLQQRGHIVGMTGDGVNDAPALKKADCGIAVSGATDAARAAASIVLLAPGLSVIIDAIKESRKIFQRMNSYAIYRIAETLRVLFFMTLAILVFNFYPLTAVMIVMLALLNDGAILSIAYDNVHYKDKPEAWDMRVVLGISTVLGVIGVVSAFGLFYLGERVFHLDRAHIQTLMYLKLSVAGHLTIFLTRTRGPFWSIRPARILWAAVLGTQVVATLIAVYGLLMTPLGWGWAAFVWGYALAWFLVNDRVKLLAYRIFDPSAAPLLTKKPLDLTPGIAARA
jgi:H+-transporting ATPase